TSPHSPPSHLPLSFSLLLPRPPRSTLFPYTTLFRSSPTIPPSPRRSPPAATIPSTALRSSCKTMTWLSAPGRVAPSRPGADNHRSEEHTSELQSRRDLVCRLLLEKKKKKKKI